MLDVMDAQLWKAGFDLRNLAGPSVSLNLCRTAVRVFPERVTDSALWESRIM